MAITVKHNKVSTVPDGDDTSVVRPSDWNADHTLVGTIDVANGGTGASTASAGLNNLLPSQTGNNGKVLSTDGTNASWSTNGSGDVVGPSSSTDNAIARFDQTTGKLIQNSVTTIDDTGNASGILSQQFSNGSAVALAAGKFWYNGSTGSWNAGMGGGLVTQQIGEELYRYGKASAAITDSPLQLIYKTGVVGASGVITFAPAIAGITRGDDILGCATEPIAHNGFGRITTYGIVNNITTNGTAYGETWVDNDDIYYNPTTGGLTKTVPTAPNLKLFVGTVINAGSGGSGSFIVKLGVATYLSALSDVTVSGATSGQQLVYNGTIWTNSNAPTISGGTINGTTIGATTPSSIVGTTITGQTGVLKGTGQNLLTQSQTFTNSVWSGSTATRADNQTTAPNGTSTAGTFTTVNTTFGGLLRQNITLTTTTYTLSAYVKKNNYRYVGLRFGNVINGNNFAFFDFDTATTNTVGISGATLTATDAGNGWYRLALTCLNPSGVNNLIDISTTASDGSCFTNLGAGQIVYVWGVQFELGSTANTYIPTTTTAVYGTPTLSFSGVSTLGLESNGALFLQPAGTGAIQAQATTSTTAGGNARGANAVDFQTLRSVASMVASSTGSVLVGGQNNTSSAYTSFVGAGANNYAQSGNSFVGGGNANVINGGGSYGAIVAGNSNTINSPYSFVGGGQANTVAGYYNFVGGGFTNSGTASAAVTTQSGTMNATTAVTLSGSNANIKVGQYITGTSISGDTYVAAISGTSLTLSKNASGSSTSTLSFYTPHGVVVGGGNNQATGSYSFIGGGGDAGTAAQRNAASGDWSAVAGGRNNLASGLASFVGGGGTSGDNNTNGNQATGTGSMVLGGLANRATGQGSSVSAGWANLANADFSSVVNGQYSTARSVQGVTVFGSNLPLGYGYGFSQAALFILGKITTDATATVLVSNGGSATNNNQVILPNNSAYYFRGEIISGVTGGGNTKGWTIEGVIKRGANAASTTLVGTPTVTSMYADVGAATWTIAVTADTTNGGLAVTFTGQASTTIRTVAQIRTTEMTY